MTEVEQYVKARDEALTRLDVDWAMKRQPGASREVAIVGMHKARYEAPNVAAALRLESAAWLKARGFGRLFGLPWPKDGTLP